MKRWSPAAWAVLAALAAPVSRAAQEGHEAARTFLGLPVWFWLLANLVLFLGALVYFLAPPVVRFLEARGREIEESLATAKRQRAELEHLGPDLERRIAELEREMGELLARADDEGEREHRETLERARREKQRILTQAGQEIDYRLLQARQELRDYTATLAADLARQRLEDSLTPEDRRRLFAESLERLEKETAR